MEGAIMNSSTEKIGIAGSIDFKEINSRLYKSFIDNSREWLIEFENGLMHFEKAPSDAELLNDIFRIAHNIKGTSGLAGLDDIYKFAHHLENTLQMIRQGKINPDKRTIDLLLEAADIVWLMVDAAAENQQFDFSKCQNWMSVMEGHYRG
jgi:two-component system chemotaxis sensor kinase CheA